MRIGVKRLHPDAVLPWYAHPGEDLAADLCSLENVELLPGQRKMVATGIAVDFPRGVGAIVTGRSGLFIKQGLLLHTGTIDQGYRGDVSVLMVNVNAPANPFNLGAEVNKSRTINIKKGDRIAQMRLVLVTAAEFEEVAELGDSARGEGGFGSTGVGEVLCSQK